MRSKQEAAAARAAAAQRDEARSRLSGLEVERQGYVARGDEDGVAAVDDEIAKYTALAEDGDEIPVVVAEPVDLDGLTPQEVFEVLGVPADVVEAFAAAITANGADEPKAAGDTPPAAPADADKPAEPTGRRGRARTAAQPADAPADAATPAPAGD